MTNSINPQRAETESDEKPLLGAAIPAKIIAWDDEHQVRQSFKTNPQEGIAQLYQRYYQPLCTHAVKFVSSREVAEDIVSDIFFQLYAKQIYTDITTSFRLYLFSAVRNRAYNYLRWDLGRKADLGEIAQKPQLNDQQPDHISEFEELYHDVQDAINKLPVERRKIYLMRKFEGKKYQEIADELHLSVKTIDVQLHRANQFIRALLKDKWLIVWVLMGYFSKF
ncbi:MAG: RNA polymerase sigma-70 factor [Spirosomaceae bacterium]|nr:RNA polymerase sigma-70 factor [Spirosomataceae bacterium]